MIQSKIITQYWLKKMRIASNQMGVQNALLNDHFVHRLSIDKSSLAGFKKLAKGNPLSELVLCLTAYHILLCRFFADYASVITMPGLAQNDDGREARPVFFQFLTSTFDQTIRDAVQMVKAELSEVLQHKDYDASELESSNPEWRQRLNTISKFTMVWGDTVEDDSIGYMLKLALRTQPSGAIAVTLTGDSYTVETSVARRFMEYFAFTLTILDANLEEKVSSVDIFPSLERTRMLTTLAQGRSCTIEIPSMVALFEKQVAAYPQRQAVVFKNSTLTYADLNARANVLARLLIEKHSVRRGEIIGLIMPKSDSAVVAILAILKAGAAYLPIATDYPRQRIDYIIENSGPKLILTSGGVLETHIDHACIDIDQLPDGISDADLAITIDGNDLAYIVYTSGSTGNPKGAMIEHLSSVNMILDQIRTFGISEDDRILWFASLAFDASVSEIFMAIGSGATLVIPDENIVNNKESFLDFINFHSTNVITLPPSFLDLFSVLELAVVKCLITAGEPANPAKAIEFSQSKKYFNAYGPTECAVCATIHQVTDTTSQSNIPIGRPISNSSVYVLDENFNLMPIGVKGNIFISGTGVGRGYLNNTELTTERFIANPFATAERMYYTGDTGRWLEDGQLEFCGRNDDQVKIRGYRIELGEIENVLHRHAQIVSAAVLAIRDRGIYERKLVAFIISRQGLSEATLTAYVKQYLPTYMIPAEFISLDSFPKTPNGKIDRKHLALNYTNLPTTAAYTAPRNEIEAKLAHFFQYLLGVEKVGVTDHFFRLGGHSLKGIRLLSQIHREFQVKISFSEFFDHAEVTALALLIQRARLQKFEYIPAVEPSLSYAVSTAQRRLWILSQFEEGSLSYHMPGVYLFEGEVDVAALEHALQKLVERHEILRTVFGEDAGGEIRQYIKPVSVSEFRLTGEDLSSLPDPESEVKRRVEKEYTMAFDLATGPLMRASLYRLHAGRWVFVYTMHHIVSDGWSMGVIMRELLASYASFAKGTSAPSAALRIQYKDYASWERMQLASGAHHHHQAYWLSQLSGDLPVLELPTDRVRPAIKHYQGGRIKVPFGGSLSESLKSLVREQGCTLFMGLVSAVKVLLHRYTNQGDIIIGTAVAGRDHSDLEDQVGCYVNALALRTRLSGADTFKTLLSKVRATTLEAYEHSAYPFDALVGDLSLPHDMSRNAIFEVMVVLQNTEASLASVQVEGLRLREYDQVENPTSKFDLSFDFSEGIDGLLLNLEYNSAIYDRESVVRLGTHLVRLVECAVQDPSQPIAHLDYLSDSETQEILYAFNTTQSPYPRQQTIISLFEDQVQCTPSNIALVCQDRRLTYAALNTLANQLGDYLRQHYQVQADDLISIKLERSEWMVVAMLAVLKAGGAYVPVDPRYPQERIDYIVSDSRCKVLIDEEELERFRRSQDAYGLHNPVPIGRPDSLAYVIYTSGTTGKPKGVMIENRNVVSFFENLNTRWGMVCTMTLAATTNFTFDISVLELLGSLCLGMRVVMLSSTDPEDVITTVDKGAIDVLQVTPSRLDQLLEANKQGLNILKQLKVLLVGGEALSETLAAKLNTLVPTKVFNVYGPTETTIWSSATEIGASVKVSIGSPLHGEHIYIIDSKMQLCPVGVIGEICIGGVGIARGYWSKPKLTDEKFVPNPFHHGGKIYKTGDLGKWTSEGTILFLGRRDGQIKLRGHRIELGEIKNALTNLQGIYAAEVIVYKPLADKVLVAYVVAKHAVDFKILREHLSKTLPAHMVPQHFIQLEAIPLNFSGKVDEKKLPPPEGLAQRTKVCVEPRNDIEARLARLYQEILGVDRVSVTDDFFEIGGHSLRATRLVSLVNQEFGIRLKLQDIFFSPTIEGISGVIKAHRWITNKNQEPNKKHTIIEI
jgi:amino acid adenylation domain-containing protein